MTILTILRKPQNSILIIKAPILELKVGLARYLMASHEYVVPWITSLGSTGRQEFTGFMVFTGI